MSNVDLHVTADITLRIRHLRGRFDPVSRAQMPLLDDKHSYVVAIASAQGAHLLALRAAMSLARLWHRLDRRRDANRLVMEARDRFPAEHSSIDAREAEALSAATA